MSRWRLLVFTVFSSLLFLMAIKKAATASITWDEAFTYFEFIKTGHILPGAGGGMAANNHLLNTWLSCVFTFLFGADEFTLRLGNLLFYAVYLSATSWLALRSENVAISFAVFALLNLNPYLFDFFCLSRGYGIAHSCLMLCIVFLYSYLRTHESQWLKWMLFSSMAGMLAGAMLLPAFGLLYAIVFFIEPLLRKNRSVMKIQITALQNSINRIPVYVHLIFVSAWMAGLAYLILLQRCNAYLFGGQRGLVNDTILSLIRNSNYLSEYSMVFCFICLSVLLIILLLSVRILRNAYRHSEPAHGKTAWVLMLTFLGIILFSGILFYLFSTPLPAERTALYLYIICMSAISIVLLAEKEKSLLMNSACTLTGILMMVHFISTLNFKSFHDWRADADAPLMIHDLSKISLIQKNETLRSSASLELELPIRFYVEKNLRWKNRLTVTRKSYPLKDSDIYFLEKRDSAISDSLKWEDGWISISYPEGGTMIYNSFIVQ